MEEAPVPEISDKQLNMLIKMKLGRLDREYAACMAATRTQPSEPKTSSSASIPAISSTPVTTTSASQATLVDVKQNHQQDTEETEFTFKDTFDDDDDDFGVFQSSDLPPPAVVKKPEVMSEEKIDLIKNIMSQVNITVPPWAKNLDDNLWNSQMSQLQQTGFESLSFQPITTVTSNKKKKKKKKKKKIETESEGKMPESEEAEAATVVSLAPKDSTSSKVEGTETEHVKETTMEVETSPTI